MNIALGCMVCPASTARPMTRRASPSFTAAIERGVTLLDTGDFYGSGHNELLIGKATAGRRDQVQLSVKFGVLRGADGSMGGFDGRPAALKNFLRTRSSGSARSRRRLSPARWIPRYRSRTRSARSRIW